MFHDYCVDLYISYLLPVSRNHQGRRGTTADIGDNLLPSLTVFGCSLTAVEVETGPLSDVVFPSFLLPSFFLFPGTVPCTTFLQRPLDLITCPNHRNFLFSQLLIYVFSFDRNNFKNMLTLTPFLHGSDRLYLWRYAFRDISVTNTRTTQQEKSTLPRIL